MNVNTMRRIDRFIGVPLCWILGLFRAFVIQRKVTVSEARNILIIKFFGLGSILLSTPAVREIKRQFPQSRITYLSFLRHRELLERFSMIDSIMTIDNSSVSSFLISTMKAIECLRRMKYDIVFDFEFFSKFSTVLSALTNAPHRVGFALPTRWRYLLITHQVPISKDRHVKEAFCEQIAALTGTVNVGPVIVPKLTDLDRESFSSKIPVNGKPCIVINVNAGDTFRDRRWLPNRFAELVSQLASHGGYEFYFIGNEREREYVQTVINLTSCEHRCYNIAGVLSLPETCVLFERCEVLISNDSGPVHLAAAFGARVIALYGPETPQFYGPIGENVSAIYKKIPCSPCMNVYTAKNFHCPYNAECMRRIEVNDVERVFDTMLAEHL